MLSHIEAHICYPLLFPNALIEFNWTCTDCQEKKFCASYFNVKSKQFYVVSHTRTGLSIIFYLLILPHDLIEWGRHREHTWQSILQIYNTENMEKASKLLHLCLIWLPISICLDLSTTFTMFGSRTSYILVLMLLMINVKFIWKFLHSSPFLNNSLALLVDQRSPRVFTSPVVRLVWHEVY